jgi:hypothetical protein
MTMTEAPACSICGGPVEPWPTPPGEVPRGYGHNPEPLASFEERCCDRCNIERVIPARMGRLTGALGTLEQDRAARVQIEDQIADHRGEGKCR